MGQPERGSIGDLVRYRMSGKLDRELADAVLEVSVQANREIVEELKEMKPCARHYWKSWNRRLLRL